ncbi:MAG: response regulator [Chitinispirillaceae bacterium]
MLEVLGYQAILTRNGAETVEKFLECRKDNRKIEGMIFDLTIPGEMGGKDTLEQIRKIDTDIPVFVASGYSNDPIIATPQRYGFAASICKPFRKDELAEMLQIHLGNPRDIIV